MSPTPVLVFGALFLVIASQLGAMVAGPLVIGLAAGLFIGFKAGQYHRGWMHARGIRKSHWKAIAGEHR